MKFIYPAVFRKTESGTFKAFFPDLECCYAEGDTLDDAIDKANEAAYDWISVELSEEGALPSSPMNVIWIFRREILYAISL